MFAVDRENRHLALGGELRGQGSGHDQRFFVGQGDGLAGLDRGPGSFEPGTADAGTSRMRMTCSPLSSFTLPVRVTSAPLKNTVTLSIAVGAVTSAANAALPVIRNVMNESAKRISDLILCQCVGVLRNIASARRNRRAARAAPFITSGPR